MMQNRKTNVIGTITASFNNSNRKNTTHSAAPLQLPRETMQEIGSSASFKKDIHTASLVFQMQKLTRFQG